MIDTDEFELRTKEKNMLFCTYKRGVDGTVLLRTKNGRKEDVITLNEVLSSVYGCSVMIVPV